MIKLIIPVVFINKWPPVSLAIQFATTQFVYWQPQIGFTPDEHKENDISLWDASDVSSVAREIVDRYKTLVVGGD